MTGEVVFIDTNILIYAHDRDAGDRHHAARKKVAELWDLDVPPSISVQVLQEFYVNLVKKGVKSSVARETVNRYLFWHVVDNDRDLLLEGMVERERWQLSLWDALILAAARRAGAQVIWSEDFNVGQDYGGIAVVNPLRGF